MNILIAAVALGAAQAAPAPADHSQHSPSQHAQHMAHGQDRERQGAHKCCREVDGKLQCSMMKGPDGQHHEHGATNGEQGHKGHSN